MGVDMRGIEQDPLMVQPQPQIRYPTSPSAPQEPTLMSGVTDTLLDKGTDQLMDAVTDKALSKVESTTVKAAGAAMGDPTGGVATELGYEHLLKPLLKDTIGKLFFNDGGMVGGPLSSMMTNVSKVRYKQSGGKVAEEIELNYHGPLASKGV